MSLSCSCDGDDYDWYWWAPDDFSVFERKRGARCVACKTMIRRGDTTAEFQRTRAARGEVEERIYGEGDAESVSMAPWFLCESCGGLWFSLHELGFECVAPNEVLKDIADYRELARERAAHPMRSASSPIDGA